MYNAQVLENIKPDVDYLHLLVAVDAEFYSRDDFSIPGLRFTRVAVEKALVTAKKFATDAVLVIFNPRFPPNSSFESLRSYANLTATPIILYSSHFDAGAMKVAVDLGFDDYYFGSSTESLLKKFRMIKKIKRYKSQGSFLPPERNVATKTGVLLAKQAIDGTVSALALIALSPLLALIAVVIKLESKGPVFYISKRAGRNYKIFDFYKFRSMQQHADTQLDSLMGQNQYGGGAFVKIQSDPRVTPFGKFLRKTSLDELPQLFNVVKGDMFLVGNRPLPLYEASELTNDKIARRFLAPAGLTGLWQVTKRGKAEMSEVERIELDITYARKHSLLYDFKLLISTVPALFQKEAV